MPLEVYCLVCVCEDSSSVRTAERFRYSISRSRDYENALCRIKSRSVKETVNDLLTSMSEHFL
jgi:hypothetical protein